MLESEQGPPECRAGGVEQLYRVCPQCSGNVTSAAAVGAVLGTGTAGLCQQQPKSSPGWGPGLCCDPNNPVVVLY